MDIGFSGLARGIFTGLVVFVVAAIAASLFCAVLVLVGAAPGRPLAALYLILAVLLAALLPWLVRLRRRFRAVRVALHLDSAGLVSYSATGSTSVPWEAVADARIVLGRNGRRLVVRLRPGSGPSAIGFLLRLLDVDEAGLRAAFAQQSGGRVLLD